MSGTTRNLTAKPWRPPSRDPDRAADTFGEGLHGMIKLLGQAQRFAAGRVAAERTGDT